jgi:hypothetical protein
MKLAPNPICLILFSGITSVSTITFVCAGEPANDKSTNSQDNPLRIADSSASDDAKNNKVVRGSTTELPSQGSIDFIIVDPADASATIASKPNDAKSVTSSVPKRAASESDKTRDESRLELQTEYERLHSSVGHSSVPPSNNNSKPTHPIVYGEDTDNPAFTSSSNPTASGEEFGAEPPELNDGLLTAEELTELQEISLEEMNEPMPEMIDQDSQVAEDLEAGDVDSQVGPQLKETEDAQPSGLTSRPTLRRPKPILIDPIETNRSIAEPKLNIVTRDKKSATEASQSGVPSLQTAPTPRSYVNAAEELRAQRTAAALRYYSENPESVAVRSPWAVMHAILPYGQNAELDFNGQRVNAIAWMCANKVCKTQSIFSPVGRSFRPNVGGGVQGHDGQFLAILAQSGVSSSYPLYVNNRKFSVANLVQYEMATCKPKSELTFKLISLTYYLGTKQTWRSRDRQAWNVERLLGEELAQPVNGAACGGTHRLMGIYFAIKQRREEGMPLNGKFAVAEKYIRDYKDYAWSLQNPDGSFSTNWFESRGMENNNERKVQTTGHILEWLIYCSTPEELKAHRTEAAIDFLLSEIYDNREHKWPIGPRGHALRAVSLYQSKCLDAGMQQNSSIASQPNSPRPSR